MPRSVHPDGNLSISQVVSLLGREFGDLTESKVRFLEQQALIEPKRNATGHRTFGVHDVAVLKWILTCQRDRFLPLSVIGERIERGEHLREIWADEAAEPSGVDESVEEVARVELSDLQQLPGVESRSVDLDEMLADFEHGPFTVADLAAASGADVAEVEQLVTFGLLSGLAPSADDRGEGSHRSDETVAAEPVLYGTDALVITRIAREFATHGLDARHLRMIRNAAVRDVAMFAESLQPLMLSGEATAVADTGSTLARMAVLSQRLRALYMCEQMREALAVLPPSEPEP